MKERAQSTKSEAQTGAPRALFALCASRFAPFVGALWIAFLARGAIHALTAPMWDGFDEPFHLAYAVFVADHGRPPGFQEASFPRILLDANQHLPSFLGYGAPSFAEWRAISSEAQSLAREAVRRQTAGRVVGSRDYLGPNYERQQGPLFYYLAAPLVRVLGFTSLPALLVGLRLFCVGLASLIVPLSAALVLRLLGPKGLVAALPLVALLPNTLFFADRLTNDALAWPLLAWIAVLLLKLVDEGRPRDACWLGLAVSAGIWTKLTLLPALAAAAVAVWLCSRFDQTGLRRRLSLFALAAPATMAAILFAWNRAASGSWSGLVQAGALDGASATALLRSAADVSSFGYFGRLLENHLWSGGWGFVKPPWIVYLIAVAAIAAIFAAVRLFGGESESENRSPFHRSIPLMVLGAIFLLAMLYHATTGALASRLREDFPRIGAEGWYLDLLRPLEAAALAGLALSRRGTREAVWLGRSMLVILVVIDVAATLGLLIPAWSGSSSPWAVGSNLPHALAAAPLAISGGLVAALVVVWLTSIGLAWRAARGAVEWPSGLVAPAA